MTYVSPFKGTGFLLDLVSPDVTQVFDHAMTQLGWVVVDVAMNVVTVSDNA
jgi:hypothetical protein